MPRKRNDLVASPPVSSINDHSYLLRTLAKILARQAAREWYEGQISPDLDVFPPPPDRKLPP